MLKLGYAHLDSRSKKALFEHRQDIPIPLQSEITKWIGREDWKLHTISLLQVKWDQ